MRHYTIFLWKSQGFYGDFHSGFHLIYNFGGPLDFSEDLCYTVQEPVVSQAQAVSEKAGVSPLPYRRPTCFGIKTYPIPGISRPDRFYEAMGVFSLGRREIAELLA